VPNKYLTKHASENGTLVIERRWIDSELPQMEVLDALAYVYDQLRNLVLDLFKLLELPIPRFLDQFRPEPMAELIMDRALYLSMKDGSSRGLRLFRKKIGVTANSPAVRRYLNSAEVKTIREPQSFRDLVAAYFQSARKVMLKDGFHRNFLLLLRGIACIRVIAADFPDRPSRYVIMRDLAKLAKLERADGAVFVGEAWTAFGKDLPRSGFADESLNRGEAIVINAVSSRGEQYNFWAPVERKPNKPRRVSTIGKTIEDHDFSFMMYPFLKEWGCVNGDKVTRAIDKLRSMSIDLQEWSE
jgi:hypothetical protein